MDKFFGLTAQRTTPGHEMLCGLTTFLTMSYILFLNPSLAGEIGMSTSWVFVATAVSAGLCTLAMGLVAGLPLAMAPGVGLSTLIVYTFCLTRGFVWQEALALTFLAGLAHLALMLSPFRKHLVNALPNHLKIATGAGVGLFIAYIGLKTAGLLTFTVGPDEFTSLPGGGLLAGAGAIPSLKADLGPAQYLALGGLLIMLALLALEKQTGERYAAIPVAIILVTFIGIPLNVTQLGGARLVDFGALAGVKNAAAGWWGSPGLASLWADPEKIRLTAAAVLVLLITNVLDSVGTILGISQSQQSELLKDQDLEAFRQKGLRSRLDRGLAVNSLGGIISALWGTTTSTTYIESITGVAAGGRTGLTAVTCGLLFLLCLPLINLFGIVPAAAVAPALIIAGSYMVGLLRRIDWGNFEEALPAFMTLIFIPLTYGVINGLAAGILTHLTIQAAMGKWRQAPPLLYILAAIFIVMIV